MNREEILKQEIRKIALQLDQWALESVAGGWSTHQVEPMQQKADELWALLARLG